MEPAPPWMMRRGVVVGMVGWVGCGEGGGGGGMDGWFVGCDGGVDGGEMDGGMVVVGMLRHGIEIVGIE